MTAFFISLSTGCDSNRVFEQNQEIPGNRWSQDEPLRFEVEIQDTVSAHNVYINIRNSGHYQFSNLFMFVNTTLPNGDQGRDTLECIFADADGKWKGEGLGDIWDNRIMFRKNFRFPVSGTYVFELEQAMRISVLPNIMDAGIRIEKTK